MSPTPTHTPTPEPDPVDQTDDAAALRSEAASRRRQLRAVEAERDELKQWKNARLRGDVEALAAEMFADPSDLWSVTSVGQLQGDDGLIDPEKTRTEFERVLMDKPHWRKPEVPRPVNLHQGPRGSVESPKRPSFGETIKRSLAGG